jgi:5-formyltetrahydrofolate cyclo-ligase
VVDDGPVPTPDAASRKAALRGELRAARRAMSAEERAGAGALLLVAVLALPEVAAAQTVAAYVSSPLEPATGPVIDALVAAGKRVILPVLRPDLDLDWAVYAGPDDLVPTSVPGRGSLLEPSGPRLGPDAVASAGLVLVPALAVDRAGRRLGQGGGSYDRALARVAADVPLAALLYEGELVDEVPSEPHDRPVTLAVQPSGVTRLAD